MMLAVKTAILLFLIASGAVLLAAWELNREAMNGLERAGKILEEARQALNEAEEYRDRCRAEYLAAPDKSGEGDGIDEG